jgi:hypothetical protein
VASVTISQKEISVSSQMDKCALQLKGVQSHLAYQITKQETCVVIRACQCHKAPVHPDDTIVRCPSGISKACPRGKKGVEKQHCLPDNLRFQGLVAKLVDQELCEKVAEHT